ncbi:MAG: hypothetical protein JEZ12_26470 [Desulfobacterium sp.]|nr:hypothetical protein [Desulfobacterium sp.]
MQIIRFSAPVFLSIETDRFLPIYVIDSNLAGKVRELRNMMERAVLTAKGPSLSVTDLGLDEIRPERAMADDPLAALPPLSPVGIDLNAMRFHKVQAIHVTVR